MTYTVSSGGGGLMVTLLELESTGWEGAGWGKVCLLAGWGEELGEGDYGFVVEGVSNLYRTMAFTSFSFTVLPPLSSTSSPSPSPSSCSPNLWDPSSLSIYGIQTFPSGLTFLPSSLRSNPFHITTKSLSPCNSIQMSKDILPPAKIDWAFLDPIPLELNGVDPNDWANGTQLVIPESILLNRQAFPPNEPVGLQVNATFRVEESGKMVSFLAETYVQFLYAPVDVVTTPR